MRAAAAARKLQPLKKQAPKKAPIPEKKKNAKSCLELRAFLRPWSFFGACLLELGSLRAPRSPMRREGADDQQRRGADRGQYPRGDRWSRGGKSNGGLHGLSPPHTFSDTSFNAGDRRNITDLNRAWNKIGPLRGKFKIRSSKPETNSKDRMAENSKRERSRPARAGLAHLHFVLRLWFGFRASDFPPRLRPRRARDQRRNSAHCRDFPARREAFAAARRREPSAASP